MKAGQTGAGKTRRTKKRRRRRKRKKRHSERLKDMTDVISIWRTQKMVVFASPKIWCSKQKNSHELCLTSAPTHFSLSHPGKQFEICHTSEGRKKSKMYSSIWRRTQTLSAFILTTWRAHRRPIEPVNASNHALHTASPGNAFEDWRSYPNYRTHMQIWRINQTHKHVFDFKLTSMWNEKNYFDFTSWKYTKSQ